MTDGIEPPEDAPEGYDMATLSDDGTANEDQSSPNVDPDTLPDDGGVDAAWIL